MVRVRLAPSGFCLLYKLVWSIYNKETIRFDKENVPALRPVRLANRYLGYLLTVILTGHAKDELGKEIIKSCKALTTL